jgi:formylglycine-generating enzyme required for sulfatase activity
MKPSFPTLRFGLGALLVVTLMGAGLFELICARAVVAAAAEGDIVLSGHQLISNRVYRFSFEASAGQSYPVGVSEDLVNWITLTNVAGAGGRSWVEDPDADLYIRRYYHVGIVPPPRPTPIANMVLISPGTFTMGSPDSEVDRESKEGPQTTVTLTREFWIGKYEVTQGEEVLLTGTNRSIYAYDLRLPVDFASWAVANHYCEKLTEREVAIGHLPLGYRYRLPTEAEWEYACRAGTTTAVAVGSGTSLSSTQANFDGAFPYGGAPVGRNLDVTSLPGSYPPNAWGVNDMHGNVAEWCLDYYGPYPGGSVTDPKGPAAGSARVLRGGAYNSTGKSCRSARRDSRSQTLSQFGQGFRVVLAADP